MVREDSLIKDLHSRIMQVGKFLFFRLTDDMKLKWKLKREQKVFFKRGVLQPSKNVSVPQRRRLFCKRRVYVEYSRLKETSGNKDSDDLHSLFF